MKRIYSLKRKTIGDTVFDFCNYFFMIILAITFFYPFWTTFLLSFSTPEAGLALGFHIWIHEWTSLAYRFAFSEYGNVGMYYYNSVFRTVLGTSLVIVFTLLGAYPLSKKNIPGRNLITIYFLITMFFGGGLVPSYLLIRKIGLLNSRLALILPGLVSTFYIIIVRNFLMTIDTAYEEAALMDGANYLQILTRIIVPLSKPVIATIALWSAVGHWNAWFDALIYIKSDSKQVLQVLLRRLMQEVKGIYENIHGFTTEEEEELPSQAVRAAVTMITIGPIILVYPFIQKYFIKGIFIGSLKG